MAAAAPSADKQWRRDTIGRRCDRPFRRVYRDGEDRTMSVRRATRALQAARGGGSRDLSEEFIVTERTSAVSHRPPMSTQAEAADSRPQRGVQSPTAAGRRWQHRRGDCAIRMFGAGISRCRSPRDGPASPFTAAYASPRKHMARRNDPFDVSGKLYKLGHARYRVVSRRKVLKRLSPREQGQRRGHQAWTTADEGRGDGHGLGKLGTARRFWPSNS